jgi:undecaprenyl diphosphate synthase
MDGNGRWAVKKNRPRTMGHRAGLRALRSIVEHCGRIGVAQLTVFAFSSENWNRPEKEVSRLMELFMRALDKEGEELHENGVRLRFIGDMTAFPAPMQKKMRRAERRTAVNERMTLNVAANYGGRWDICNVARSLATDAAEGRLDPGSIDEALFESRLSLGTGAGPLDPHGRRDAHQQLPVMAGGVHGTVVHAGTVARFLTRPPRPVDPRLSLPGTALRQNQRTGTQEGGLMGAEALGSQGSRPMVFEAPNALSPDA